MDLKTAERIMHDFGKFTEIAHGNLLLFFLGEIPECLLPYQKKTIEEALQIMEVYYHSSSDHETVGLLQAVKSNLLFYGADEKAIDSELREIVKAIKHVLYATPPELAADIIEQGIVMSGGSSLLRNIDELVYRSTGVKARVADDALLCVARGTGIALEHLDFYKRSMLAKK